MCQINQIALISTGKTIACLLYTSGKTVSFAVFTLGILLILTELLLPSVFGWGRLKYESCPILPLLAGAELPGNVLARFDVLWMGFLLYSLLFSIGSFLHLSLIHI